MLDPAAVWRTFDQATLDSEYNAAATVPSLDPYLERYAAESARVRASYDCRLDIRYGPGEREVLDVFPAPQAGSPVLIYMHGGFWRRLSKSDFDFIAEPFVRAGITVVVPSYSLAPTVALDEIVREMRQVFEWTFATIAAHHGDPARLYVSGHSAGGQLAGMLAATAWPERSLPAGAIKGVFGISGLYDLEPVRHSYVNDWLQLDEAAAEHNSPIVHLPRGTTPLLAVVGGKETAEFQRQTLDFAAAWRANGSPADAHVIPGLNHFDIVLELTRDDGPLRRAALDLILS